MLGIHLRRKQRRSHIHFRCTESSNASAEGAKFCFGLEGEDRRHAPMGKSVFLNNGPVFIDFGAFFVHHSFQPYLQQLLQSLGPLNLIANCLLIHIFVWKKCATVDKRQGDPVACGHWKIFMCILDILGIFQPQFSIYFAVNNSDRGQWQGRQGNMLGENLFLVFGI